MSDAPIIVGNNLAAMVAALDLAEDGSTVRLLNAAGGWGGHFSGFRHDGHEFDGGMILMEFGVFNTEAGPDLLGYDARRRNDCGRFAAEVGGYVQSLVACREVPVPELLCRGRSYPDLLIANRFDVLKGLPSDLAGRVRSELEAICNRPRDPLHASAKLQDAVFLEADLESASVANHGPTLHAEFFEPICRKIAGCPAREVIALYHRVPWLPLFHPETLLSQFTPSPQALPATRFHYPVAGHAGAFAQALARRIEAHPRIQVLRAAIGSIRARGENTELILADGGTLTSPRFAWSLDPGRLAGLLDPGVPQPAYRRASVGLSFMRVPAGSLRRRFSTIFVPDPACSIYRISDQDACAGTGAAEHRLVAEFHPSPRVSDAGLVAELVDNGIIDTPGSVTWSTRMSLDQALMMPNRENRRQFLEQLDWIGERMPAARLIGASAGFFASSLNDQVVQGLKLARTWA